jgi:hypothetical protein
MPLRNFRACKWLALRTSGEELIMNETKDDPQLLLFTCERCSFWPMAYQGVRPYGGETSFSCPRCKAVCVFKIRNAPHARPRLEALAG